MLITTHETAKESPKEVSAPEGINSDKDSTNNDQNKELPPPGPFTLSIQKLDFIRALMHIVS